MDLLNIKIKFNLNNDNIRVKNKAIYPTSEFFTIKPNNSLQTKKSFKL